MNAAYLNWREGEALNLSDIFAQEAPLEMEIGCGKGKFIVSRAMEHPDRNFIAVDWSLKWMKVGVQRAQKRELKNLFFVRAHAEDLLKHIMQQQKLAIVHMYFPDPWPKKRHHKRRLFRSDFVDLVHEALESEGLFEIATDFSDYYEVMMQSIEEAKAPWVHSKTTTNERLFDAHLKTNYELKYEEEGRPLYYIELKKGVYFF